MLSHIIVIDNCSSIFLNIEGVIPSSIRAPTRNQLRAGFLACCRRAAKVVTCMERAGCSEAAQVFRRQVAPRRKVTAVGGKFPVKARRKKG